MRYLSKIDAIILGGVRYDGISQFLDGISVFWIKNGRYSAFQTPNGDGKTQFLTEDITMTVILQNFDYDITVIFENIKNFLN